MPGPGRVRGRLVKLHRNRPYPGRRMPLPVQEVDTIGPHVDEEPPGYQRSLPERPARFLRLRKLYWDCVAAAA